MFVANVPLSLVRKAMNALGLVHKRVPVFRQQAPQVPVYLNMQQEWSGPCLQVRGSGKFGGADVEQKEESSASSLGSERFLLATSQKEVALAKLQKFSYCSYCCHSFKYQEFCSGRKSYMDKLYICVIQNLLLVTQSGGCIPVDFF